MNRSLGVVPIIRPSDPIRDASSKNSTVERKVMQDKLMWFPKLQSPTLRLHSILPSLRDVAGAVVMALVMAVA